MLDVLLRKFVLSETNNRCRPRQADDMTPLQYCVLGHVTRTADRPLSLHQQSSAAEKIAPPHAVDIPPNITHTKKNIGCVRVAVKGDSLLHYCFEST